MRQALLAGVSALLMAVLIPGWLLPVEAEITAKPLVLIIEEPEERLQEQLVSVLCGGRILELSLEEYLVGVVLSEMPASFETEALKAQAVAARTFAMRQMAGGKHDECDLCADSACCQAWNSREAMTEKLGSSCETYWSKAARAVQETVGEVLTYDGQLIDAVYFSCSGGRTEDAVAVWGSEVAYLQSVPSVGEEQASVFETEVTVDAEVFQAVLLQNDDQINLSGSSENWFGEVVYTDGGGVQSMEIGGRTVEGTALRSMFRLNSTCFTVSVSEGNVIFRVKGYGHRVGMSQYGANAMAKAGSSYREILSHYYVGTQIGAAE